MSRLLLVNGRIFTGRPGTGFSEAVAIAGRRIIAAGSLEDVSNIAQGFEEIDLAGGLAVPAFTDCHIHLLMYGISLSNVQLAGSASPEEAAQRVAGRAQAARPGSWITGIGWSKEEFQSRSFPSKAQLDAVCPYNPVALYSRDYHSVWLNSAAIRLLDAAAIARRFPKQVLLNSAGEPDGVLLEHAAKEAVSGIPGPSEAGKKQALDAAFAKLCSLGILSAHNMDSEGDLGLLAEMDRTGRMPLKVAAYVGRKAFRDAAAAGLMTGHRAGARLVFAGLKLIKDGTLGSQTALMLEPFHNTGGKGIDLVPENELDELISEANSKGIGVAVHAIGDGANRAVLDSFSRHGKLDARLANRVEHAQLLTEEDLPRLPALGLAASMQPIHMEADMATADSFWGERCRYAYAFRSLARGGAPLLFGSDAPVEDPDPIKGIACAVTRKGPDGKPERGWYPEERITVEEAVRAYTWNPAVLFGEEGARGSIEPGKLADITILDTDIFSCPKDRIRKAKVVTTIMEGDIIHRI